ncbi:hypothetical protein D9M71_501470 [compost metagenome]
MDIQQHHRRQRLSLQLARQCLERIMRLRRQRSGLQAGFQLQPLGPLALKFGPERIVLLHELLDLQPGLHVRLLDDSNHLRPPGNGDFGLLVFYIRGHMGNDHRTGGDQRSDYRSGRGYGMDKAGCVC